FNGRDLFAPVAGALSKGVAPEQLGPQVSDFVRLARLAPRRDADGTLRASIIHVDRFGNCVTNITPADLPPDAIARGASLVVNGRHVTRFQTFYAEAPDATGTARAHSASDDDAPPRPEPFAIWGSAGFLELSVFRASAAQLLGVRRGDEIMVTSDR
ncbi:MAG TPA: SAM hydroxide adenosyltransferase, partial [Pyrinomonadaceae bacterium]|nr:SAM hydroxide adenosyltransferase [Pyrinomonadaceae bacterium]